MADLKLQPLLEFLKGKQLRELLEPFLGSDRPRLETSRLQAPMCFWAVYVCGDRRATLKSFFSQDLYERYVEELRRFYGDRFDQPSHTQGGILRVPDINALVWAFPFDPHMPCLDRFCDAAWVAEVLGCGSAGALQAKVLSYNPEISAIFQYRDATGVRAYGKAAPQGEREHVHQAMEQLWRSSQDGQFRWARPLAYLPNMGFLAQAAVPGRTLPPSRNSKRFLTLVQAAGQGLAYIHSSDIEVGPERKLEADVSLLRESLTELELTAPPLFVTLKLLVDHIDARTRGQPELAELVPSHGDYKWNQFLESRGGYALIDLELFCQAERWRDVGYFCAYLPSTQPEDWRDGAATEVLRSEFLDSYRRAAGVDLDMERIGLYEAATLATRAMTQVWQYQGNWQLRASQLLDLAIDRLVNP